MANWKEQFANLWQRLGKKQRYSIIGAAIILFIAIIGWSYWWGARPEYVPLFTHMDTKDAGDVAAKLKEMKIPYEIGENGTAILVSSKDVYRVRLDLASQGLPKGNKGFEIFDQNKFGTTEFQNKVYYLQALQGELSRTIEQMSEVEKARVHIVLPEDSLYKKNEKPATASIMLKLKTGAQLSKEQVRGIVNLVGHSIQSLKPENITVLDDKANILNDPNDAASLSTAQTLTQIDLTKKVQNDLQKSAQSLLEQVLGPNKAAIRVSVELNFDQRTIDRQVFEPVVDEKGIVRSEQTVNENYKGTSPVAGGPPGTISNIPGYVTGSQSQSNYEKKEATRNYEINETKEKVIASPGSIKRMTVAVLVDSAVDRTQQDSIMRTVVSSIGVNPVRGDTISVEFIPFSTEVNDKLKKEEEDLAKQQATNFYIKVGLGILTAIIIMVIVYMYQKRKRIEEEKEIIALMEEEANADKQKVGELSQEDIQRNEQKEVLQKLAKAKPEEVANIIRAWLADE